MLDQEEHSAETESGEKGEVIKRRTELERWGEYKTGGEGRKGTAGLKKKNESKEEMKRIQREEENQFSLCCFFS